MATCPSGHDSADADFCDVCGVLIGAAPAYGPGATEVAGQQHPAAGTSVPGHVALPAGLLAEHCPSCGTARYGQFCEACGHDFTAATPDQVAAAAPEPMQAHARTVRWTAVLTADRAYYEGVRAASDSDADLADFPAEYPHKRFPLSGTEVSVGRRSAQRGSAPDIDLAAPPADPGVSRQHLTLCCAPDGTWSVVDLGSANGTLVNGTEIPAGVPVQLADGDQIHLGTWTSLTIRRD